MRLQRGHVYAADLNPRFGTEPGKVRPVLVIQTDVVNTEHHPSTIVCLLTTKVRNDVVLLRVHLHREAGLTSPSDIMIDQLRAIDNRRLRREIGKLSPVRMSEVEEKLRILLEL